MLLPQASRDLAVPCEQDVTVGLACAKPACVEGERWLCQRGCLGRLLDLGEKLEHCHSHIALVAGLLRWADITVSHEHTLTLCQGTGDALPLTLVQF